jgi:hypothetical protein
VVEPAFNTSHFSSVENYRTQQHVCQEAVRSHHYSPFDIHLLASGESNDSKLSGIQNVVICKALHPIPSSNCCFLVIFDVCISFLFFNVLFNDAVNY